MSTFIMGQEKFPSIDTICADIAQGHEYFIDSQSRSAFNQMYYTKGMKNACSEFVKIEQCLQNKDPKKDKECEWPTWHRPNQHPSKYPWSTPYDQLFDKCDAFGAIKGETDHLDPLLDSVEYDLTNCLNLARKFQELEYTNLSPAKQFFYKKFIEKATRLEMPSATTTLEKLCETNPPDENLYLPKTDRYCRRFQEMLFSAAHGPTSQEMQQAREQQDIITLALGHRAYNFIKWELGNPEPSEIKDFFDDGRVDHLYSDWESKTTLFYLLRRYHSGITEQERLKIRDEFLQKVQAVRKARIAKAAENKI